jgi:hypothetical protein
MNGLGAWRHDAGELDLQFGADDVGDPSADAGREIRRDVVVGHRRTITHHPGSLTVAADVIEYPETL